MRTKACFLVTLLMLGLATGAGAADHFRQGEIRAGLDWDNISAMESGVLKFGGSAGIHVLHGIEVGYEQQFIVPPNSGSESRSFGYLRAVPFPDWPVIPFLSVRAGYYFLPDRNAVAVGAGCGTVFFVDLHFAFEARLYNQAVLHPEGSVERQTEFDWRLVLYF